VRTRIVSLAVVASALALVCFGLPLAVAVSQYAVVYREVDLERQADRAASRVAVDLGEGEEVINEELEDYDTLTFRSLYDLDGERLLGRGPDTADRFVLAAEEGEASTGSADGEIVVAVPVLHEGEVVGVVRVSGRQSDLLWPVSVAWLAMAGLGVVALGLVWLLARRQARRLARPLHDLATAARRLGDGDFSVRVPDVAYAEIDAVAVSLNRTAARLDDLVSRERAFSAEASHQLRTPLTTLRLSLESAMARPDGDLRGAIDAGLAAADRIESTIDELLALARDRHRTLEALHVGALLPQLVEPWAERLRGDGRELRIDVAPRTPPAMASAAAVRQVLTVLLDNAVVHGAGTVTVTVRDAGGAVAVEVADKGAGLPEDGELFSRRPRADGHGIGLALARRLAEAEGGHLRLARPAPPVFALLLPAARPR
jgi:signal transduction histidine kinase